MHHVLILGAGRIGTLISVLLAQTKDYHVVLSDVNIDNPQLQRLQSLFSNLHLISLDATDMKAVANCVKQNKIKSIVSSLPYYCNIEVAKLVHQLQVNYFDLTEDTKTAAVISELSQGYQHVLAPQCGLAPGFISVVANHVMQHFTKIDTVKMRVGALPINVGNAMQYALTWSTDGLINEYGNLCNALMDGKEVAMLPLDDLEEIMIDGLAYEAFNTSGGNGTLAETYFGKVQNLNYKTIRYPGHCEKIRFLMNDLKLNHDRDTLKRILENSIPKTAQDVVIVYVSVTGMQNNQFTEENFVRKYYPKTLHDIHWTAIQLTTASELCAVLDIVVQNPGKYQGLLKQEQIGLLELLANRFGQYYA